MLLKVKAMGRQLRKEREGGKDVGLSAFSCAWHFWLRDCLHVCCSDKYFSFTTWQAFNWQSDKCYQQKKATGSFLQGPIINYLTTQNNHKIFRLQWDKKLCVPLWGSICSVANAQWPRKCAWLSEHMPWTILTEVLKWQPKHSSFPTDDASWHFFLEEL